MLATLAEETRNRRKRLSWQHNEELLAQLLEYLSVLRREFLMSKGVTDAPDVWRYPRPGEELRSSSDGKRRISPGQMARMLKG